MEKGGSTGQQPSGRNLRDSGCDCRQAGSWMRMQPAGVNTSLSEKLRVCLRRIPELPIHGPSNMNQRSSRACSISLAVGDGK